MGIPTAMVLTGTTPDEVPNNPHPDPDPTGPDYDLDAIFNLTTHLYHPLRVHKKINTEESQEILKDAIREGITEQRADDTQYKDVKVVH